MDAEWRVIPLLRRAGPEEDEVADDAPPGIAMRVAEHDAMGGAIDAYFCLDTARARRTCTTAARRRWRTRSRRTTARDAPRAIGSSGSSPPSATPWSPSCARS